MITDSFQTCVIVIALIIYAAFSTGCTDTSIPESPTDPTQTAANAVETTKITTTITVTPEPTVKPEDIKVFRDFKRAEYRNNITQTFPPNPRYQWETAVKIERSYKSYKGTIAIYEKLTGTMDYSGTENGLISVYERFLDSETNNYLGGTIETTINGVTQPASELNAEEDYFPGDEPSFVIGITPSGAANIALTYEGTESVTVPAGEYPDARKYTGYFPDGTPITFWIVQDIPVPVQYRFPNDYLEGEDPIQTFELKSWE
ncbi:hypothetical protein [Methanolacinia paynteri]|uniref:hypothetical protein n=1 Tax=Methanolacinia paynteri TaxID=230356 RepID=UPI00064E9E19|nr:hypothetical protein [Methanolacinia paynteri]